MKILFYIEPRIDLGMPLLREWWLSHFTFDIINTLKKSGSARVFEYCVAINEPLAQKYNAFDEVVAKIFTQKELFPSFIGDAIDLSVAWYRETYTDEQISYYVSLMKERFFDFVPDIIITFTPVPYLRKAFPNALILHHEVSFLSESPYPWVPYFDPLGMCFGRSSFLNKFQNDIKMISLTAVQQELLNNFKKACQTIIRSKSPYEGILRPLKEKFDHLVLLPLVGERHYGFQGPCKLNMKNEYQYLVYILEHIPKNIGVVVTYPPQLLNPYSSDTISFLEKQYPHFICHEDFRKYCSVSQYLLAYTDMVVGLGTGICFQTLVWENKLLDLGDMNIIADSSDLGAVEKVLKRELQNKDNILYWMLTRYAIQKCYLYNPEWLSKYLINSLDKFRIEGINYDFFDPIDSDERIFEGLMNCLDEDIPRINSHMSYNKLKKSYDDLKVDYEKLKADHEGIKSKCEGLKVFQLLDDLISNGVNLVIEGRRSETYTLFSKMLGGINNVKGTLMNNMAVIHIKEGRLDDAERIFQGLIKDGYNVSAVEENLQKLQCLKLRNATQ